MKKTKIFVLFAAMMLCVSAAHADSLIGQTGSVQYRFPSIDSNYNPAQSFVVGAGTEVTNYGDGIYTNIDISGSNILITFNCCYSFSPGSFNGEQFSFAGFNFTNATLNSTNILGFGADRITFDAHNVFANWQSLGTNGQSFISIDINGKSSVPEPGTMALLGTGLLGFGLRRFRKN